MRDFLTYDIIAQGVGLLASAIVIFSFTQKSDWRFKIIISLGACTFGIHFLMIGAYAGAIVAVINVTRTLFSMTRYVSSNYFLVFFIGLYIVASFFIVQKPTDLLPLFSGAVSTVVFFKLAGIKLRVAFFFTEGAWLFYSIIMKSLGGFITNIFVLSANMVTTYKLIKDQNKDRKNEQNT